MQSVPEITLVTDEHNHNVSLGMVAQLLQPTLHVLKRYMLRDIIHKQCSHSPSVVRGRDRPEFNVRTKEIKSESILIAVYRSWCCSGSQTRMF